MSFCQTYRLCMYCNASSSCRVQSTICVSANFFPESVYSTILLSRSPPYTTTHAISTTYNTGLHDCSLIQYKKHPPPHQHLLMVISSETWKYPQFSPLICSRRETLLSTAASFTDRIGYYSYHSANSIIASKHLRIVKALTQPGKSPTGFILFTHYCTKRKGRVSIILVLQ